MNFVTVERKGACALMTYANPQFGTMTAAGAFEMHQALLAAAEDDAVRAVVITGGVPGIFVRHYDVDELALMSARLQPGAAPPADSGGQRRPGFLDMTDLITAMDKPVIAAINGLCMGGGFELSLACDLRIVGADVASIGLPETRIAIFPGGGGTQRLPRLIGEAKALEFILRGQTVDAQGALDLGLVHEIAVDPLARALDLAAEFSGRGREGLAQAKRLIRGALGRPLAEGLADERASFLAVMQTQAALEALQNSGAPVEIQKV